MHIAHVGNSIIRTPSCNLKLTNVLHVPQASKNLASIHRITSDNNVFFELHPSFLSRTGTRGEQFFTIGVKGACTLFRATRPVKLSLNKSLVLSSFLCHDGMHVLAILLLRLLVWCLARIVFLILVTSPIIKCVMCANRPNVTNFPIPCPLGSLRFPYNLSSRMCGVLLVLLLVAIITMLVLLMTPTSSLGFICLNTNPRSFISFKSSSAWSSICLIVKF
jgi:hypothetical protein